MKEKSSPWGSSPPPGGFKKQPGKNGPFPGCFFILMADIGKLEFIAPCRRGRCPHRPVVHGMISPNTCGNRNIFPRGDVGIAPYGGIVHLTAKFQFSPQERYRALYWGDDYCHPRCGIKTLRRRTSRRTGRTGGPSRSAGSACPGCRPGSPLPWPAPLRLLPNHPPVR